MSGTLCPCGAGSPFADCCGRYITGKPTAPTAEALMRSRYSAYVTGAVDYLVQTTHPSSRTPTLLSDMKHTAQTYTWLGLSVERIQQGGPGDTVGKVAFSAHYRSKDGRVGVHHELSRFKKHKGEWYYLDGETE